VIRIPKLRKHSKRDTGRGPIRCPAHLQFIRRHECAIAGINGHVCEGRIIAAHVRIGTDGGAQSKPGDCWTIPLCESLTGGAHKEHHRGERSFEKKYDIDTKAMAAELWRVSPARLRYEAKMRSAG
jgi:hypothetical protein